MKHGGDRHIHILLMETALICCGCQCRKGTQGMEHQLTMTEINSLGQPGRASGVKSGGPGVFIKIREFKLVAGGLKKLLVFACKPN